MRSVLVSGPADEAAALARALRRQGFSTFGLDLPPRLGTGAAGDRPVDPVDCYIQLPAAEEGASTGSPAHALLRRVEAVAVVSPLLAWDATVLLVTGEQDARRRDALRLMAEAALDDAGRGAALVVLVDEDAPLPTAVLDDPAEVQRAFDDIVSQFDL